MKISVFYNHIAEAARQQGIGEDDVLDMVKEWGADGVEVGLRRLYGYPSDIEGIDVKDLNREFINRLEVRGLAISSIGETYDMCYSDESRRIRLHVDTAAALKVDRILAVPGWFNAGDVVSSEPNSRVVYALRDLVDYAEKTDRNIKVTIEDFDHEMSPCTRMGQMYFLLKNVPGLKISLDTGNFAFNNEDLMTAYKNFREHIALVHCKDRCVEEKVSDLCLKYNRGLGPAAVGSGYLPVGLVIQSLIDSGYDGWYEIEHNGAPDQLTTMEQSIKFLKSLEG